MTDEHEINREIMHKVSMDVANDLSSIIEHYMRDLRKYDGLDFNAAMNGLTSGLVFNLLTYVKAMFVWNEVDMRRSILNALTVAFEKMGDLDVN